MAERVYDLGNRLIEFAARVIEVVETMPGTKAGNYIAGQFVRCGLLLLYYMEKHRVPNQEMTSFTK